MRTTLTLDDAIMKEIKKLAFESEKSFKHVVNELLRAGLAAKKTPVKARPYRVRPRSMGGVRPGMNLDKALWLAEALEDEAIARKIEMRK